MQNFRISKNEKIETASVVRPSDMLVSMGDLAHCGQIIFNSGRGYLNTDHFTECLICLSHIVNRIVLSDRLFYIIPEYTGEDDDNAGKMSEYLITNCRTSGIVEEHPIVGELFAAVHDNVETLFDQNMVENLTEQLSLLSEGRPTALEGYLTEYCVSSTLKIPYAPNPVASRGIGANSIKPATTAENLIKYIEDLRKETAEQFNLLRKADVYDLKLPSIFSAVLRECNSPDDIIKVAFQMNSEAGSFRNWCDHLDSINDPKQYIEKYRSAETALGNLGRVLGTASDARLQVSPPVDLGLGIKLPSATITKIYHWLDVDVDFVAPRSFLLNLLSSAREIRKLEVEITRLFDIPNEYVERSSEKLFSMATSV